MRPLAGLVVIDEVQRRPELFPTLRVLVDEPRTTRRFLVLGSASPALLRQTSESMAGRIGYHELDGFSLDEVGPSRCGCGRFMVRQLPSWHENLGKRHVKAPKLFVRDSGMLHALLGLTTAREIAAHPKLGASWEGFAMSAVIARLGALPEECFFWATHSGAELDLLVVRGNRRLGFEFKRSSAPSVTQSMHVALQDLRLQRLWIVHAGERSFDLAPRLRALPLSPVPEELAPLP